MDIKNSIIKSSKVVVFALGVLSLVTGCNLETTIDEQQEAPKTPIVYDLPSERQPFLAPKETEVVMREVEEKLKYRDIKVVNKSHGGSRKSKPSTPKIVGKYSVNREQIQRNNNMDELNF